MNFRQFLKEDPDRVRNINGKDLLFNDYDAFTIVIFKNCYFYANSREYTHENIFLYICLNIIADSDLQQLDKEKRDVIKNIKNSMDELFPTEIVQIGKIGKYKSKLIKKFIETIQYANFSRGLNLTIIDNKTVIKREAIINHFPDVLLARIWKNEKVISFWNIRWAVMNLKIEVYKFLHHIDDNISNFRFEVSGSLVDYSNFDSGNFNEKELDVSKAHTLSPELKNKALKKMGVVPKPPIDIALNMFRRAE
jgi:hypothetical protein